jgi:hypothetical protein
MPSLGGQLVRSPAFALDLRGRDPAAVVRETEDGAVRIVGRYVPRTEALRIWDIRGSNVRLNRVFELNRLPYDGYHEDDAATAVDRRGKRPVAVTEEGPSQEAALAAKKRKIGTAVGGLWVSESFAVELMGTCAALRGDVFARAPGVFGANAEGYRGSMAKECSGPPRGWRRFFYVSYGSRLEDFSLRAEYCCCCIGSDGEGSSRRCPEASGGRQARGSFPRGKEGAGSREVCRPGR